MSEAEWSYGDSKTGVDVPKSVREGGAYSPMEKVELSGNGTSYRSHCVPMECQTCGNIQRFATGQFQIMSGCHECGGGRWFEFDFDVARSLLPWTEGGEYDG